MRRDLRKPYLFRGASHLCFADVATEAEIIAAGAHEAGRAEAAAEHAADDAGEALEAAEVAAEQAGAAVEEVVAVVDEAADALAERVLVAVGNLIAPLFDAVHGRLDRLEARTTETEGDLDGLTAVIENAPVEVVGEVEQVAEDTGLVVASEETPAVDDPPQQRRRKYRRI